MHSGKDHQRLLTSQRELSTSLQRSPKAAPPKKYSFKKKKKKNLKGTRTAFRGNVEVRDSNITIEYNQKKNPKPRKELYVTLNPIY